MAISILKQNSLTFPWLLAQNKIPWLFPDHYFFPCFPCFPDPVGTLYEGGYYNNRGIHYHIGKVGWCGHQICWLKCHLCFFLGGGCLPLNYKSGKYFEKGEHPPMYHCWSMVMVTMVTDKLWWLPWLLISYAGYHVNGPLCWLPWLLIYYPGYHGYWHIMMVTMVLIYYAGYHGYRYIMLSTMATDTSCWLLICWLLIMLIYYAFYIYILK